MIVLRSIAAVVAGMIVAGAIVMVLTIAAVWLFFGGDVNAPPTAPYLAFNLAYTFGAAIGGGWVAGLVARKNELLHGAAMAAIMLVLSLGGGQPDPASGIPAWYGMATGVLGATGAVLGAGLRGRRGRRARSRAVA